MLDGMFKDTMISMNWTDIEQHVNASSIVLLPLGVVEEHGPHLCLGTDILTAHVYCLAIRDRLEQHGYSVVIAPPFYWGVNQCTSGFMGSFKIRKETAKALLFDILYSLDEFGFNDIIGINAHGDINHSLAVIEAFKDANEQLNINARYAFDEWRIPHFGLKGNESFLCPIEDQKIIVSSAEVPDVHGGDIETATIFHYYPHLVDVLKASELSPVALEDAKVEQWLFGGHIKELTSEGYLGSPANYKNVDALLNINDYAKRATKSIINQLKM